MQTPKQDMPLPRSDIQELASRLGVPFRPIVGQHGVLVVMAPDIGALNDERAEAAAALERQSAEIAHLTSVVDRQAVQKAEKDAEIARLWEALTKFGVHQPTCVLPPYPASTPLDDPSLPACTCGLSAAQGRAPHE